MARLFKVKEWEERKRALAAECDVYRQTLHLEVQNLRLYSHRTKRKFNRLMAPNPVLMLVMPLVSAYFKARFSRGQRRGKWWPLVSGAVMTWQLYRKVGPLLRALLFRSNSSQSINQVSGDPAKERKSYGG
jgi:hypothetical protein